MASAGRVLVYGGKGALGSAIVSLFRQHKWWVGCVDHFANEEADANIFVESSDSWTKQHDAVLQAVSKTLQVRSRTKAGVERRRPHFNSNPRSASSLPARPLLLTYRVWTSAIAAGIAAHHLKEGGLLALTGAQAALKPTPGMIGYGLAKAGVHHLVGSLAGAKSGLPKAATVVAVLPVTLDTPANRNAMPKADFGSWTPLSFVAELLFKWTGGQERPSSGSLVQLETKEGNTTLTTA
ncbi:unnamed protein product [Ixodes hexagonus]